MHTRSNATREKTVSEDADTVRMYKSDLQKGIVTIDDYTGVMSRNVMATLKDRGMISSLNTVINDTALAEAVKLIRNRGLDNADGRDCAIIKLIDAVEKGFH